jgi:hypothetical protein
MDNVTERQINDIQKLIKFYSDLGETNKHIENYVKELHVQLEELKNPKETISDEGQDKSQV